MWSYFSDHHLPECYLNLTLLYLLHLSCYLCLVFTSAVSVSSSHNMFMLILILLSTHQALSRLKTIADDTCEDEYVDCDERSDECVSDDVETVLNMLTHCRPTCLQVFITRY